MPDDVARAVGAGSTRTVMIAGKECQPKPLTIKQLAEVERECLATYRREYLEGYSQNIDLLPEAVRVPVLREKMEEAAKWDVHNLPPKYVYDPGKLTITDSMREWVKKNFGFAEVDADGKPLGEAELQRQLRQVVAGLLDQSLMSEEIYREFTGLEPRKEKVGYVNWWITGCFAGMLTMCWICFKDSGVTRDEVGEAMLSMRDQLMQITREIEQLTAPATGNG